MCLDSNGVFNKDNIKINIFTFRFWHLKAQQDIIYPILLVLPGFLHLLPLFFVTTMYVVMWLY